MQKTCFVNRSHKMKRETFKGEKRPCLLPPRNMKLLWNTKSLFFSLLTMVLLFYTIESILFGWKIYGLFFFV